MESIKLYCKNKLKNFRQNRQRRIERHPESCLLSVAIKSFIMSFNAFNSFQNQAHWDIILAIVSFPTEVATFDWQLQSNDFDRFNLLLSSRGLPLKRNVHLKYRT